MGCPVTEAPAQQPHATITCLPVSVGSASTLAWDTAPHWCAPSLHQSEAAPPAAPTPLRAVACVVHLTPGPVARKPEYVRWVAGFGDGMVHLLAAEPAGRGAPVMRASATLQAKLNVLAPTFFPLQPAEAVATGGGDTLPHGCVAGTNMLRFQLRPLAKRGLDRQDVAAPLDVDEVQLQLQQEKPEVIKAAGEHEQRGEGAEAVPQCVANAGRQELEVTFLGTGAAVPSKYRNVTGVLANLFDRGALLMDCGEPLRGPVSLRCMPCRRVGNPPPRCSFATQARAAMASYCDGTARQARTTWSGAWQRCGSPTSMLTTTWACPRCWLPARASSAPTASRCWWWGRGRCAVRCRPTRS